MHWRCFHIYPTAMPGFPAFNFDTMLAHELCQRRKRLGMSQTALAEELGIDQTSVSKIEAGARRISAYAALRWLVTLGTTADEAGAVLAQLWHESGAESKSLWSLADDHN
ncbi:helix-turn-helix transcriptional regulator [Corynebacterium hindlerae]|uniref:helix-turn-helix transcriptional regulator n=1 Tax=Corynebacterium hindlerae TaxID=699041 RepID=UPI003AB0AC9F